jgi:quercetin dioxygenase-like cupin family protein
MELEKISSLDELGYEPIEQPEKIEFHFADEIFVKMIAIKKAGTMIPGHAHTYDHTSLLASGKFRLWVEEKLAGDYIAPTGILIKAGAKHMMLTLEDNTVFACIHNTHGYAPEEMEDKLILEKNTSINRKL